MPLMFFHKYILFLAKLFSAKGFLGLKHLFFSGIFLSEVWGYPSRPPAPPLSILRFPSTSEISHTSPFNSPQILLHARYAGLPFVQSVNLQKMFR